MSDLQYRYTIHSGDWSPWFTLYPSVTDWQAAFQGQKYQIREKPLEPDWWRKPEGTVLRVQHLSTTCLVYRVTPDRAIDLPIKPSPEDEIVWVLLDPYGCPSVLAPESWKDSVLVNILI